MTLDSLVSCMDEEFHPKNLGFRHADPKLFVNSQWPRMTQPLYIIYRAIMAVGTVAWVIENCIDEIRVYYPTYPGVWFTYATNWSFVFLAILFTLKAILAMYYYKYPEILNDKMPISLSISWLLKSVFFNTGMVVTVCFWTFILFMDTSWYFRSLGSEIKHSLNSVIIVIDLLVTGTPVRFIHFVYTLFLGIVYAGFNAIYFAAGDGPGPEPGQHYTYSVLDWKRPGVAIVTILLCLMLVTLVQIVIFEIYKLRLCIYKKMYPERQDSEKTKILSSKENSYDTMQEPAEESIR